MCEVLRITTWLGKLTFENRGTLSPLVKVFARKYVQFMLFTSCILDLRYFPLVNDKPLWLCWGCVCCSMRTLSRCSAGALSLSFVWRFHCVMLRIDNPHVKLLLAKDLRVREGSSFRLHHDHSCIMCQQPHQNLILMWLLYLSVLAY